MQVQAGKSGDRRPTRQDVSGLAKGIAANTLQRTVRRRFRENPDRRRRSSIALTVIEGGMNCRWFRRAAWARKTTFTFMTDRMGTVVEDSGTPSAGSSVTGFFRLTGQGVEVRYADGRSSMLSASPDGGVQMMLDGDDGPTCRAWYPAGHSFSDLEKKAALSAYASRLGLPVAASDVSSGCSLAPSAKPATIAPAARRTLRLRRRHLVCVLTPRA